MGVRRTALGLAVAAAPRVYFALLRPWQLRWGATPEEAHRDLPGDDLVTHYLFEATRAVPIAAPPDRVWPWIPRAQLAAQASGGPPASSRDER